jgi:hypothetical protein
MLQPVPKRRLIDLRAVGPATVKDLPAEPRDWVWRSRVRKARSR